MAVESNGSLVKPGQKGGKGANGHAVVSPRKPIPNRRKSGSSWTSTIARLLTWYSIITVVFRCPATVDKLTDASPKICKPYFQASSVIAPYLNPYYDIYAAPYVDAARPYYNTLNQKVIVPATVLGKKHLAPRVAQAQAYGQAQWEKTLQPEVQKYQGIAKAKYDQTLGPHLDKAAAATGPYLEIAKTNAKQTYYGHILPTYTAVQPYAVKGYGAVSDFTVNTGIPYAKWAWATSAVFLDRTVWPKLRILYGENVEPQLVRIGERLGRYRDGKKLKAVISSVDSSSSLSAASQTASSISSSISSAHATTSEPSVSSSSTAVAESTPEPVETPLSNEELIEKAQKIVQEDLKKWQTKFAKAADEGSDEMEARITEITDKLVENQAHGMGKALLIELEETIKSNIKSLQPELLSIVKKAGDGDKEDSEAAIGTAVRKAGLNIKDKAQAVRTWRQKYDDETNYLVSKTASDTFEILDTIRDMGLQEIGMRWAWTDGITHKDWTKYHQLKNKFDEWRDDVGTVATGHPGLEKARAASDEVEGQAMAAAEDAAKELARLKEVALWKLSVGDVTDDFSTKIVPAKIAKAVSDASEAIVGTASTQGTIESLSSAASSVAAAQYDSAQSVASDASKIVGDAASSISASVVGTPQGSVESIASVASASASSLADQASSSIIGTQQGTMESVASVASASASSALDQVSSSVIGTQQGSIESVASVVSESASSLADQASSSVIGTSTGTVESLVSEAAAAASSLSSKVDSSAQEAASSISSAVPEASSISSAASSASSQASKKVWGGAMAQHVEAKKIIYEDIIDEESDDDTYSEKMQSMASQAGDKFADLTKAVSEAMLKPTSTQGTVASVTSLAAEQYSSALSAASSVLYGTEQGTGESIASAASSKYAEAVAAASAAIYGTPVGTFESMSSAVSSAASSAYYGPPTGVFESISAVAASRLSEGLSIASAQFSSAKSSIGPARTPLAQKYLQQAENQFYAGVGMAHARYSEFMDAASTAVMPTQTPLYESAATKISEAVIGTETPLYESVASAASENWESLITKASEQIYGKPTPYYLTKAYSVPGGLYSSASDGFVSQYEAMQSLVGELVSGKDAPFTESVYSRFSIAMATGAPDMISAASSMASEAYVSATSAVDDTYASAVSVAGDGYASVTSVISVAFTPPPALESILDAASSRVNDAVEAASIQFYGTQKGTYEQATSSAASIYSSAQSVASEKIYGSSTGYVEAASSSISAAASSAQAAISEAIYGTTTGTIESATSVIGDTYASATSVIAENASSVQAKVSSAIYGPEQGAVESAQARLVAAVESARVKLSEFAVAAGDGASDAVKKASEGVEEFASSVSSAVSAATNHVKKDEL
ncbi:hypothetical protein BP6252_12963 [Coleophoma cylindrospora]|uniref:Uncharacterized protein n=1 Tax=Coleophoma cylindrospora TaxID=1849047 RepID=A0A3D8QDF3_9HELO|nr:hypothetical protein BP6252_12963 [Coleophoma cylindrospora]